MLNCEQRGVLSPVLSSLNFEEEEEYEEEVIMASYSPSFIGISSVFSPASPSRFPPRGPSLTSPLCS